jgi:hypothetical protein
VDVRDEITTWKWAFQHIAVPPRAHGFSLTAVSCTSARACTAVGSKNMTVSLVSGVLTVAERWNGHSWVLQATPARNPPEPGRQTRMRARSWSRLRTCHLGADGRGE